MNEHWSIELWLAKQRQAELLREAEQIALERAVSASGQSQGWYARLLAAWGRRLELARASKPAMSE
jgi:hypothetical protein